MVDVAENLGELTLTEICSLFDKAKMEKLEATNALEKSSKDVERLRKELVRRLAIPEGTPAKPVAEAPAPAPVAAQKLPVATPTESGRRSRQDVARVVEAVKGIILAALEGGDDWKGKETIVSGRKIAVSDWNKAIKQLKASGKIEFHGDKRSTVYRLVR